MQRCPRRAAAVRPSRMTALGVVVTLLAVGCGLQVSAPTPTPRRTAVGGLPPVGHVFVVNLENRSYDDTFGGSSDTPYLARTLVARGALLRQYYAIGHVSLDNYIAEISGQAPDPDTQGDCVTYADWSGSDSLDAQGQVTGNGCVYPETVKTIADQLDFAGRSWKAYMEDMGNDPQREAARCGRPALGERDHTQKATADDQYAARHDPFVYFHSIVDDAARCAAHVVSLSPLQDDLRSVATTPTLSVISPNLCNDGHDGRCAGPSVSGSTAGGGRAIDAWLAMYAGMIMNSSAYRQDGLLLILFDEADTGDTTACCGEVPGPNSDDPGRGGPGGGRVGAVALSPFIRPGTVSDVPYNHYAMLRSLEDLLGITSGGSDGRGHLGFAGATGLRSFGADVFTAAPPS